MRFFISDVGDLVIVCTDAVDKEAGIEMLRSLNIDDEVERVIEDTADELRKPKVIN